ncbi:YkgJ family cysteine cluster protein [Nitrospira sp. Nam74]
MEQYPPNIYELTLIMTENFRALWEQWTGDQRVDMAKAFNFYVNQVRALATDHADAPLKQADALHELCEHEYEIDKVQRPDQMALIRCRKGCSYCCEIYVGIMPIEGKLLLSVAAEQNIDIDYDRLRRQVGATTATWQKLAPADRRCVFLSQEGTCLVYEKRPLACRKHVVISEPNLCKPGSTSTPLILSELELITMAAYNEFSVGSMPEVLLKERV